MPCPWVGRRAPELCAGRFDRFAQEILQLNAADACLRHSAECSPEQRRWLLEDFEAGRQHIAVRVRLQTAPLHRLPRSLCVLAHADPALARQGLRAALREFDAMPAATQNVCHALTRAVCAPGDLRVEADAFLNGTPMRALPRLQHMAGRLCLIPLHEIGIERKHAQVNREMEKG
eukprot:15185074-Alexandrium_andersonii.AAC.1